MPKLSKQQAASVEAQESGTFEPLPDGIYVVKLRAVTPKTGPQGPYWQWEFEIPEDYENNGRRFWDNTSLSKQSEWKMKQVFDAFGASPDTDTDELCGELVRIQVGTRTIQSGARAGELANEVQKVLAMEDDEEEEEDDVEAEEEEEEEQPVRRKTAVGAGRR